MFTPPDQLNVYPVKSLLHLFLWGGACLSGVKSFLHLFLWGGAYFIGVLQKWKETNFAECPNSNHYRFFNKIGKPPADLFSIRLFLAAKKAGAPNAAIQLNRNNMLYF